MLYWVLLLTVISAAAASAQPAAPAARGRAFLDSLVKGDFGAAASMLDTDLAAKLPAAKLELVWRAVEQQAGAYRQASDARVETSGNNAVVFVTCEFERVKLDARIPVNQDGRISGLNFSQHVDYTAPDYVKAGSFQEREVTVGSGEWALHGTLSMPAGEGPFPALVLLQGSGNTDRDSTLGPNKIFRDIAWGVASRGIAVLRYNKRSNEHREAIARLARFTVKEEIVDDAVSACALLRATPGIDAKRIFVLGHSLGATVAPRVAQADPSIAGVVVLGGTTHSLLDVIVPQMIHNYTMHGPMNDAQQRAVDQMSRQVARAKDPNLTDDAPHAEMPLGAAPSYWIDLRDYHPDQLARTLKQPMLIMQAERDYQVTMDDFAAWKKALEGRANVEFRSYPKLNHFFIEGEGVSSDEEYVQPGHVAARVVEDVASWVKAH